MSLAEPTSSRAPYTPPPLPPVRANLPHVVLPITGIWFVVLVILLLRIPSLRAEDSMIWLWTAAAGTFLGGLGVGIYSWQRSAARRGHRSAQQLALDERA